MAKTNTGFAKPGCNEKRSTVSIDKIPYMLSNMGIRGLVLQVELPMPVARYKISKGEKLKMVQNNTNNKERKEYLRHRSRSRKRNQEINITCDLSLRTVDKRNE